MSDICEILRVNKT